MEQDGILILVDGLRLQHYVYVTDLKNKMERFVQKIKDGTDHNYKSLYTFTLISC